MIATMISTGSCVLQSDSQPWEGPEVFIYFILLFIFKISTPHIVIATTVVKRVAVWGLCPLLN